MGGTEAHGVHASIGLSVGRNEPVSLRPLDDTWAVLTIGGTFEAILAEPHLTTLATQLGPVLAHLREPARP